MYLNALLNIQLMLRPYTTKFKMINKIILTKLLVRIHTYKSIYVDHFWTFIHLKQIM